MKTSEAINLAQPYLMEDWLQNTGKMHFIKFTLDQFFNINEVTMLQQQYESIQVGTFSTSLL